MDKIKAIIFDVDGVLIDADYSRVEKYRRLVQYFNIHYHDIRISFNNEIKPLVQSKDYGGVDWLVNHLSYYETIFGLQDHHKDYIKKQYADGIELEPKYYPAYKGTKEVLEQLSKDYILVAYSAAKWETTRSKLEYNNINRIWAAVNCGNDGDSNSKERVISQCIEDLGARDIEPHEIAIVDDRIQAGIKIGKKYGLHRIHIKQGIHANNEYVPDRTIKTLGELC